MSRKVHTKKRTSKMHHSSSDEEQNERSETELSSPNANKNPAAAKVLAEYLEKNKNLKKLRSHNDFRLPSTINGGVYLLQVPKSVDPKLLKNVNISFNKERELTVGDCKLVAAPTEPPEKNVLVLNSKNEAKIVKLLKVVRVRNQLEHRVANMEKFATEKKEVPFPDDIKIRHPIFGVDYRNKVKLNPDIEEKIICSRRKVKKEKIKSEF